MFYVKNQFNHSDFFSSSEYVLGYVDEQLVLLTFLITSTYKTYFFNWTLFLSTHKYSTELMHPVTIYLNNV